jgi:pimeloyl-ACP methyl ester carboxylesterase
MRRPKLKNKQVLVKIIKRKMIMVMNAIDTTVQTTAAVQQSYITGSVISRDGTFIGYRQYGRGPGIVLVQGAMGFAENYSILAETLSAAFTVYVPDRRGRGMSPLPFTRDYTIQRDVEDLEALLVKTGTHNVYGLSAGAVISLAAAMSVSAIHKLAVFDPPLFESQPLPTAELARFEKAIAQGNTAAALTAAGKAAALFPSLKYMPNWLLNYLTNRMLASEARQPKSAGPTLSEITLTLQYDFKILTEIHEIPKRWSDIKADILLLGGGKSPAYLKSDLDALEKVLPHARRVTFPDLGHGGSWNYDRQRNSTGNPQMVAGELRQFFA